MESMSIGKHFDDADSVFALFNSSLTAFFVSNALHRAGVLDALAGGVQALDQLAAQSSLPVDKLARLLDFLAGHEIIERPAPGRYAATPRTANLIDAAPYLESCEFGVQAGFKLLEGLRSEHETPFAVAYGQPVFEYLSTRPEAAQTFGAFMGWMTRRVQRFIFAEHRFEPFATVADIGGSMGDLLLAILGEYPGTRGVLFDLPGTVELARPRIAASPFADRVELVGGSFFEAVPSADLYTMKQILHDWDDEECSRILGCIRKAINRGGRLAVIDHILSDSPAPDEAQSTDVSMMVWDTGHERRLAEFEALFDANGFRLDRVTRNPRGHSVIEAVPV